MEDEKPYQTDFWYIWDNWAYNRHNEGGQKSSQRTWVTTLSAAVVSDPTDMLVESAPPYAPPSRLSSNPSFATASATPPATASANVLPNPAAIQPVVGGANAPPPVLHVFTNQLWNPGDLAVWGSKMPTLRKDVDWCAKLFSNICTGYNTPWRDTLKYY